MISEILIFSCI